MATTTHYPLPSFYFTVGWGDDSMAFSEATPPKFSTDVIEYRSGNDQGFHKIKMSGLKKFDNITLKRGMIQKNTGLYDWITSTSGNVPDRRTITLKLLNNAGDPVYTVTLSNAFPVSYKFADLKAASNEVAVEELEVAYETGLMA